MEHKLIDLKEGKEQGEAILREAEEILRRRAESLASDKETDLNIVHRRRLVAFTLGQEKFGIDITFAKEIQPLSDITVVPCTPAWVLGAVNIRGAVTTVIDIRHFFSMPAPKEKLGSKVIVIDCDKGEFGIVADQVTDVLDIPVKDIQPPLATMSGVREEYISGVASDMLVILDIEALAADKRLVVHEEIS